MNLAPRLCPVCADPLRVTRLECGTCGTALTGSFGLSGLAQLTSEQLGFVETFVRCEGKFNRMEKEYNLSYPTLRTRLREIIAALGYPVEGSGAAPSRLDAGARAAILDRLSNGEIGFEEAMELLGGLPMTIITLPYPSAARPHIRRFDVNRDLSPVADLIEMCFADTLDHDGRQYIRRMRASSNNPRFLRWAERVADPDALPMAGFVWQQEGSVAGNLSLIRRRGYPVYLIANVAVHPDYRRRGIARAMTEAAFEYIRDRQRDSELWLHVREENEAARRLYDSMGFLETTSRTNWRIRGSGVSPHAAGDVRIIPRRRRHWAQQRTWLDRIHPPELGWYIPLDRRVLRPGLAGLLFRFLNNVFPQQWAAERDDTLLGVLSYVQSLSAADRLWLAAAPDTEDQAVLSLVPYVRRYHFTSRTLDLEYPAGRAVNAFETAGFTAHQTLIWMKHGG